MARSVIDRHVIDGISITVENLNRRDLPETHPKFEKVFELAWEKGHSSGYSEVEIYFGEFAELVTS